MRRDNENALDVFEAEPESYSESNTTSASVGEPEMFPAEVEYINVELKYKL